VKGSTREQTVEGTAVAMVAVADREQANTSPQYLFQDKKRFLDMNCVLYLSTKSILPIYGVAVWWTAGTLTLKKSFSTS
jgi:hypothetical protein